MWITALKLAADVAVADAPASAQPNAKEPEGGVFAALLAQLAAGGGATTETITADTAETLVPEVEGEQAETDGEEGAEDIGANAAAQTVMLPEGMVSVAAPAPLPVASMAKAASAEVEAVSASQGLTAVASNALPPSTSAATEAASPTAVQASDAPTVPAPQPGSGETVPAPVVMDMGKPTLSVDAPPDTIKLVEINVSADLASEEAAAAPRQEAMPLPAQARAVSAQHALRAEPVTPVEQEAPEAEGIMAAVAVEAAAEEGPAAALAREVKPMSVRAEAPELHAEVRAVESSSDAAPQGAPVQQARETVSGAPQTVARAEGPALPEVPVQELTSAATRGVKQLLENGEQRMLLRIVPRTLGELQIEVTRVGGEVQVQLTATTQAARELLDAQTHHLREALVREGFEAPRIQVMQSNTQNNTGFNSSGQGHQPPAQGHQGGWQPGGQHHGSQQGSWHQEARYGEPPAASPAAQQPARVSQGHGGATLNVSV